jgi:ribonuclease P protein component
VIEQATRAATGSRRFRRADRLRSSRDYARVRRTGRRLTTEQLSLEIATHTGSSRLGLIVGKRVGNAVARVRVKRAIREWFRTQRRHWPRGMDLVVMVRPGAELLSTRELWQALELALARAER